MSPTTAEKSRRAAGRRRLMNERTQTRLVDQFVGDGWLRSGRGRIGQVSYVVIVHEIRTFHDSHVVTGTEISVRLHQHSIDQARWLEQVVTLELHDGRRISGFLSADGTQLVRTGVLG